MPTTLGDLERADGGFDVGLERTGSSTALKPRLPAAAISASVLPGRRRRRACRRRRAGSSWRLRGGVGVVGEEGLLAGAGVLDDVPAVAGEVGAVDDERADGAHAGGLLELVGPAAVVGEGLAAEELGVVGGRVADDAEDDLALDVDAGVVVPVELGRGDAVADEDDGRVDVDGGGVALVGDGVVGAEA